MRIEPATKRTFAFFDGQNLFHAAKDAFGYTYPNFDPKLLTERICAAKSWTVSAIYFYTGIPSAADKPEWNAFWTAKLATMGTRGIHTFSRPLRYRNQQVLQRDGTMTTALVGQEKGVDVRIALDIVRFALEGDYDGALIFSQDQDLSEAVQDVRKISVLRDRWIKCASAFPMSPASTRTRGINGTDWIPIDRRTYDACIDPGVYRRKPSP
jgi:uncharacterized LabA/DUF88 family protein